MIKILATSDWHLGNPFHGFDRQEEHADFLRWLLGAVGQKNPDALLVSGDIFDSSNPSAASQELYYSFLDTLTQRFPQLQTIIIAGNHDSAARLEAPRLMLERHRVYVRGLIRGQEEGNFLPDDLLLPVCSAAHPEERAWVLAVPYLRDGDFTRGMSYGEGVGEFLRRAVEAANLRRDRSREALILMAHLYATGSEIAENSSERIVIGGSEMVSLDEIDESVTLALLGHLHRNQKVNGRENWLYPGSALPMSFAEKGYRHGAVYYEIEDGRLNGVSEFLDYPLQHPLVSVPAKPLPLTEVLDLLRALPDKDKMSEEEPVPYLEVNVLLDAPVAGINKQVEDVLQSKNVRLCRTVIAYRVQQSAGDGEVVLESVDDLLTLDPIEVIRKSYQNKFRCEMRDELVELARRAVEAARREGGNE